RWELPWNRIRKQGEWMRSLHGRASRSRDGFTLVEGLVAAAIVSVVLAVLMSLFTSGSRAARRGLAALDLVSQAATAGLYLKRDLRGALDGPSHLEFKSAADATLAIR